MVHAMAIDADPAREVRDERERLARLLHAGLVQQVTALSLAVDSAMLHATDGYTDELRQALHTARRIADLAIADCRAVLDDLRNRQDP